jgi:hypothetical protein
MNVLQKSDTLKLTSYEIKKEIKTDSELKEYYFQAVSNSSWANYGYFYFLISYEKLFLQECFYCLSKCLIAHVNLLHNNFSLYVSLLNWNLVIADEFNKKKKTTKKAPSKKKGLFISTNISDIRY